MSRLIVVGLLACREQDCEACPFKEDSGLCLKLKAEVAGVTIKYVEE